MHGMNWTGDEHGMEINDEISMKDGTTSRLGIHRYPRVYNLYL
jgi:hypothetical protein